MWRVSHCSTVDEVNAVSTAKVDSAFSGPNLLVRPQNSVAEVKSSTEFDVCLPFSLYRTAKYSLPSLRARSEAVKP
jgi:hypothetical protein